MAMDTRSAKDYILGVDLSGTPRGLVPQGADTTSGAVFDKARDQAEAVGSGIFSFAQGVTPEVREAISDSALLAQLVANKFASSENDPVQWFNEYSGVLQKLGWTLQEAGWSDYSTTGRSAEVHEKIMEVLTVVLGAGAAALTIIAATVSALKGMRSDDPWLTLFNRESQHARIARFQVGLVEKETASDVFVSLLGCLIVANDNITQVLFFRWKDANASFRANNAKVSINRAALLELGPIIRKQTRAYQVDYVSTVLNVEREKESARRFSAAGAEIGVQQISERP